MKWRVFLLPLVLHFSISVIQAQSDRSRSAATEYAELLPRIQQGDMNVDFRSFRIDGALVAGPRFIMREVADRDALKASMAVSNPQGALDFSNRTLELDYASAVAHFDAMTACRALSKVQEAAKHEKLMNALLDSISKAGDGKSPETSYLAVTTQEEYIFMSLRLGVKPKAQSLINQNGHFYDRLEVTDPKTNTTQYLWFNADVQMNPDGLAVPNSTASSNDSTAPVVVATAQTIAPMQPTPNGAGMQFNESKNAPSSAYATGDHSLTVADHAQPSQPQTLYDQDGVSVIATETQDTLDLEVSEPDPILVSVEVDRNQNGQFDRLVDVAFRPQANGKLCPQYLIDSQHNTPCGGVSSHAYLKDFKDDLGRRQFVLVLPKKEISFDQPSARLAFVFRNSAQRNTSYYPVERFQKAINVSYSIKQFGAAQTGQSPDAAATGATIRPELVSGQAGKQYTPPEQGFWSHQMKIGVTRRDAGSKYHFVVNFTVPDPTIRPNFPSPYPFNVITVYGNQLQNGRRVDLPNETIPPIVGDWKPGDPVRLELDLPKEYADPSQGWTLRFCIGNKSGCMPSSNLLLDSADAASVERDVSLASSCGTKAAVDALPTGVLDALNKAVKANDFEEVIRLASQPESGLKVSWLNRNSQGTIVSYGIVNRAGCTVTTMMMTVN